MKSKAIQICWFHFCYQDGQKLFLRTLSAIFTCWKCHLRVCRFSDPLHPSVFSVSHSSVLKTTNLTRKNEDSSESHPESDSLRNVFSSSAPVISYQSASTLTKLPSCILALCEKHALLFSHSHICFHALKFML